jgi:predicted RNA-binding Zn-ribbon protein involved in translation (DUF1610 family)
MEIAGKDTITGCNNGLSNEIAISRQSLQQATILKHVWNEDGLAFLPYCSKCKEPLVWHTPPEADSTLFHCPNCNRRWIKDDKWIAKELEAKGMIEKEQKYGRS